VLVAAPKLARTLGTLRAWTDAPWIGWGDRLAGASPARWYTKHVRAEPIVRSDSMRVQLSVLATGAGVGLVPEPSIRHYSLVPVKIAAALRPDAAQWPADELYLVTHRAMRDVPRVRVVWDLLLERWRDAPSERSPSSRA